MNDKRRQDHLPDLQKTKAKLGMGFDTSDTDEALAAAIEQLNGITKDDNWLIGINPNQPSGEAVSGESYRLPDDYPAPREILQKHFPRTYAFIDKRIREELIFAPTARRAFDRLSWQVISHRNH